MIQKILEPDMKSCYQVFKIRNFTLIFLNFNFSFKTKKNGKIYRYSEKSKNSFYMNNDEYIKFIFYVINEFIDYFQQNFF